MAYHLLSNRSVIYDAVTQATSSLVLIANQTIYVDPTHNMPGDSFVTLNGIVFVNYTSQNPLGINQTRLVLPVDQWDTYYESLTYPAGMTGQSAKHIYAHLKYTLENVPNMFGLAVGDWTLISTSGSL
jgi:hypothetical protein